MIKNAGGDENRSVKQAGRINEKKAYGVNTAGTPRSSSMQTIIHFSIMEVNRSPEIFHTRLPTIQSERKSRTLLR